MSKSILLTITVLQQLIICVIHYGCTDSLAINYDSWATVGYDNICIPVIEGCTDSTFTNFNSITAILMMESCSNNSIDIYGCTDENAYNYNPLATVDTDCIPFIYGCTDSNYIEYWNYTNDQENDNNVILSNVSPTVNTDDGSCITLIVYGCTLPQDENYNILAFVDDGSCLSNVNNTLNNNCAIGTSQTELDINNVRTTILNAGDMWWDLSNGRYEIPKGSGKHSMFAGALWIGGYDDNGQLKVAGQTYRQSGTDYWPGPLDNVRLTSEGINNQNMEIQMLLYVHSMTSISLFCVLM